MKLVIEKYVHLGMGWVCVALGMLGVVTPLLPTTVFILMAAFFFTKGSPRLRRWLMDHDVFGPAIHDWEKNGAIAVKYKTIAISMMGVTFLASIAFALPSFVLIVQACCMIPAGAYILTRPSH